MQQFSRLSHISATLTLLSQALALPRISTRTSPKINWGNCTASDPPNLRCGQIEVPVDYEHPHGDYFNITFAQLQATNVTNRIGSLIVNPGGPGGAASDLVFAQLQGAALFSPELLAEYDSKSCRVAPFLLPTTKVWSKYHAITPIPVLTYILAQSSASIPVVQD